MKYNYPYESFQRKNLAALTEGLDYEVWIEDDVTKAVNMINEPVIEIGGPTPDGFYFLNDVEFNSCPKITNISENPQPYSPDAPALAEQVDELMDATNMPYKDQSVGVFLMSAMSVSSDWWVDLPEDEKDAARQTFTAEKEQAHFEMGRVITGHKKPSAAIHSLRIKIYNEVNRCLVKDGLFFTDGHGEEISILREMGYKIIACLQVNSDFGPIYEFVAQKRF